MFFIKNYDNDVYGGCCVYFYYGGWWYNNCYFINLNGMYVFLVLNDVKYIGWRYWRGKFEVLKNI